MISDLESVFKESDYFYFSDHDDNTYCALILGRYRGKKMFGVVFKTGEGRFREDHVWIV